MLTIRQSHTERIDITQVRRGESQRAWAQRLGVSVPTLIWLEQGDPGVGLGIVATALWLMGRAEALGELAAPQHDRGGGRAHGSVPPRRARRMTRHEPTPSCPRRRAPMHGEAGHVLAWVLAFARMTRR
ncbi:hypothetical protein [uncultured Sphaerotilus sp.]|uniref:hypothetical protein n=1 Tax=uncultured Sphaerotilus sp. TaxID=474984 RepID=UPI0030CA1423